MKTFLEHALAIAATKGDALARAGKDAQAQRLADAAVLLVDGKVEEVRHGLYRVAGSRQGQVYTVAEGTCECADHEYRGALGAVCRHRCACWLFLAAKVAQRREAEEEASAELCALGVA